MVNQENQKRFEELLYEMKQLFRDTTTVVKITITADNTKVTTHMRYPDDLKKKNIAMRNVKGNWIV